MAINVNQGLLGALADPFQANVVGSFNRGQETKRLGEDRDREEKSRELMNKMLISSLGGEVGSQIEGDPKAMVSMMKELGMPISEKERFQTFAGEMQVMTAIANGAGPGDAAEYLKEVIGRKQLMAQELGIPMDTSRMEGMLNHFKTNPEEAVEAANLLTDSLVEQGFLKKAKGQQQQRPKFIGTPQRVSRGGKNFLSGVAQKADGTFGRVDVAVEGDFLSTLGETGEQESARRIAEAGGTTTARLESEILLKPSLEEAIVTSGELAKLAVEEKNLALKSNTARITELRKGIKSRASSVNKAGAFLKAFVDKSKSSGTTRTVASFLPGVFTNQAEFDQKFNAFSEVAAREKLKAAGELRPTDADVEGMKRAIFGIGRDEPVNIQLLQEFISDLADQDDELGALLSAKKRGGAIDFSVLEDNRTLSPPVVGPPDAIKSTADLTDEELEAELRGLSG